MNNIKIFLKTTKRAKKARPVGIKSDYVCKYVSLDISTCEQNFCKNYGYVAIMSKCDERLSVQIFSVTKVTHFTHISVVTIMEFHSESGNIHQISYFNEFLHSKDISISSLTF